MYTHPEKHRFSLVILHVYRYSIRGAHSRKNDNGDIIIFKTHITIFTPHTCPRDFFIRVIRERQ